MENLTGQRVLRYIKKCLKRKLQHMKRERIMLSVIIPIYNTEEYLPECLDSVKDNLKNIKSEVIMVNDETEDGCSYCQGICKKHQSSFTAGNYAI